MSENAPPWRVHRHVIEHVVAFLAVPQLACMRGASKALWEAVRAASMEDLLRASVFEYQDISTVDTQVVVVAMSRAVGPFPSDDARIAWCGGLSLLYEELQLRFPHAAAVGIPTQLAAIRPFPFVSGCDAATMCVVTSVESAPHLHAVDSIALCVRNPRALVRALSCDCAACPILCLESTPEQYLRMLDGIPLSSLLSIRSIAPSAFRQCLSLQLVCLANLPLLESIDDHAFCECEYLLSVDLSGLPSLRRIGEFAFRDCTSLQSITIANLPLLENIGVDAFCFCPCLSTADLSDLPCLKSIDEGAFYECGSLQSISLASLPLLECIGDGAFSRCTHLLSVTLSGLPSLRSIGGSAFSLCESLRSITIANLPLLESIGVIAFCCCSCLSTADLSDLPSLKRIGKGAFYECGSLQSISLADLPLLECIGDGAFSRCTHLLSVTLSGLPSLRSIGGSAFQSCESLRSITIAGLPLLESVGENAFSGCDCLSTTDVPEQLSRCTTLER